MANLAINKCSIVSFVDKFDAPAEEAFGLEAVRFAANGTVTPANGTNATEAAFEGFATNVADRPGVAVTVVRDGLLDVGNALDGMAYGAPVFLSNTDGTLSDTAGTVSVRIGSVQAVYGENPPGKLLHVHKP